MIYPNKNLELYTFYYNTLWTLFILVPGWFYVEASESKSLDLYLEWQISQLHRS